MSHNAGVQAKPRKVLTSRNRHEIAEIGAGNDAHARAEAHLQKRAPKIGVPCRAAVGGRGRRNLRAYERTGTRPRGGQTRKVLRWLEPLRTSVHCFRDLITVSFGPVLLLYSSIGGLYFVRRHRLREPLIRFRLL
jgi:hypothetical protein